MKITQSYAYFGQNSCFKTMLTANKSTLRDILLLYSGLFHYNNTPVRAPVARFDLAQGSDQARARVAY